MTSDKAIQKAALAYLPVTYKRLLKQLAESPLEAEEIAEFLTMTHGSVYKLLMVLRELKVICVVEYRRNAIKGAPIKVWGLGDKNKRPPAKISPAARSKAWRERHGQPLKPKLDPLTIWGLKSI
jgi:DNA-binding transcriptional ArsR family regulator